MKKCPRCKIAFYLEDRAHCLYCDTLLLSVDSDNTPPMENTSGVGGIKIEQTILKRVLRDANALAQGRMQYVMGSYFKTRTFQFTYSFSRNHFKMGRGFSRFFIQPLNATSFLVLPWVIYDFFDSLYFRFAYSGYCLKCGWKFKQVNRNQPHDPIECEYAQEYSEVTKEILNGNISKTERDFKRTAAEKIAAGKRSAYQDLCSQRSSMSALVDIVGIWFTICLYLVLVISLVYAPLFVFLHKLDI